MYIISIDIGLNHLGFIYAQCLETFKLQQIIKCKLVDIKRLCDYCKIKDCALYHEKCIADYMKHFFKKYSKEFKEAQYIVLEQQPPQGFICIQEIIRFQYRDKVFLVSPNTMHKYFEIQRLDYDQRKDFVVSFSKNWLETCKDFQEYVRKHDMADALCILIVFLQSRSTEYIKQLGETLQQITHEDYFDYIGTFKFSL